MQRNTYRFRSLHNFNEVFNVSSLHLKIYISKRQPHLMHNKDIAAKEWTKAYGKSQKHYYYHHQHHRRRTRTNHEYDFFKWFQSFFFELIHIKEYESDYVYVWVFFFSFFFFLFLFTSTFTVAASHFSDLLWFNHHSSHLPPHMTVCISFQWWLCCIHTLSLSPPPHLHLHVTHSQPHLHRPFHFSHFTWTVN